MNAAPESYPIVVAITGASGAIYATRMLQILIAHGDRPVHLTISPSGAAVVQQELGLAINLAKPDLSALMSLLPPWMNESSHRQVAEAAVDRAGEQLHYHHFQDYMTPIASGSFRTAGMVVCPCSGSTLSAIARAAASNLVSRAAEVHLKEHRKLVLVPRETPVSTLQLENMASLSQVGAVILPAMPGWYHGIESMGDIVDFVVSRILDQIDFDNRLIERWKET